jgi:outer membrane protein insertion porin family
VKRHLALIALLVPSVLGAQAPRHGKDTLSVDYTAPQKYELAGVRANAEARITEDHLIRMSGLSIGQEISIPGDDITKAIKRIWENDQFSSVECHIEKIISNRYVFLVFELERKLTLCSWSYPGMGKAESDDLNDKIKLTSKQSITPFEQQRIRNTVTRHYIEKGYLFADVQLVLTNDTCGPNTVALEILVDRGSKVKINDIIIEGNRVVSERALQRKMKETKEKSMINFKGLARADTGRVRFNPFSTLGNISINNISTWANDKLRVRLFKWSKYEEEKYKDDKKAIVDYYRSLGYRDASIVSDSLVKLDAKNINLYLDISEGKRYYFRNISWEGNVKFKTKDLQDVLGINKGDVYDVSRLERKLYFDITSGDISSLYMDRGHLFFDIRKEERLVGEDSIDLMIYIYEGPQAVIRSVVIRGNTKTSEHVIRRELRTLPGEYFSRADLIRSQREIAALGLFDPEQIGITPRPNPTDGTVDIEFTVVEKPSDQIELSAGWGGAVNGLFGTAGIVFNNFSVRNVFHPKRWNPLPAGDGQQLSVRLQSNGTFYQSLTTSFVEPWLGGKKPNSFGISANYTFLNRTGLPKKDEGSSYISTRSISLSYGKRLKWPDELFQLNSTLNFQNYFLRNYSGFLIDSGNANNFYLKETFSRRPTYSNPQFPVEGSSISLSMQLTPPYSWLDRDIVDKTPEERYKWIEYHKWRLNVEWYARLTRNQPNNPSQRHLVFKAAAKIGFLGYYSKDLGLSSFELFQLGGDGLSNLGGYTLVGYDIISLRGTESAFTPVGGIPGITSGNIFNKFTLELRYPFSLSAATTVFALVFAEGGNSYDGLAHYDPFKLRRSVGVGLRVFLPMFGLLGFDYGIGFDNPETQDLSFGQKLSRGAFHFKIGFEPD